MEDARSRATVNSYDESQGRTWQAPIRISTGCNANSIESVPGKVSGRPIVRGTRIMPDAIVDSFDLGETIDELPEGFPSLSVFQIERLIEFAHAQLGQPTR